MSRHIYCQVLLLFFLSPLGVEGGILADLRDRLRRLETRVESQAPTEAATDASTGSSTSAAELRSIDERLKALETKVAMATPVRRASKSSWDLRLGGRVFNDWIRPNGDGALAQRVGDFHSETLFRKARIALKGFNDEFRFKFELDFADGDADLTDTYLEFPAPGTLNWRVGRQKEPLGMENVGSSRFLTFMERASVCETLIPKRNTGISLSSGRPGPGPGWRVGYFRNANSYGVEAADRGHSLSLRWHTMPMLRDGGRDLSMVGLGYSHRVAGSGATNLRLLTGTRLIDPFGDTGDLDVGFSDVFGLQLVRVRRTLALYGEAARSRLSLRNGLDGQVWGAYAVLSCMLTGEHRPFALDRRSFDRVLPKRPYGRGRGGAWELALRWSVLDLADPDAGIDGGRLDEWTLACNWYLNANTRLSFDYMRPELDGLGRGDFLQLRFQVDF